MENRIKKISVAFLALILLQSCTADLRTPLIKKVGVTDENTKRGKDILARAWQKQGLDKLKNHQTYSFNGVDTWKGMMGRMTSIWPEAKSSLAFKYKTGTFDGQVSFQDGKKEGSKAGFQNWNYYEIGKQNDTLFKKTNSKIGFGLAAFQYFSEMLDRLRQAPIISYAGEGEMRGKKYDLVFSTWNKVKAHAEADHYIAWINKESGIMDFTQYTIRDNYLKAPGAKMAYGGIEFSDFREIDGILVPFLHTVYVFGLKENQSKFLHQLEINSFAFDQFDEEELKLDPSISSGGDYKK